MDKTITDMPDWEAMGMVGGNLGYLEMPGTIVDANANVVEGHRAEWHLSGSDMGGTELYAKSEVPAPSLSGFGLLVCVTGLLLLFVWRRR